MDAGILPVKRLDAAKSRLAPHFDARQRLDLARALLEDALDVCGEADFLRWHVLSGDASVRALAEQRGFLTLADPGSGGLNTALEHGIRSLRDVGSVTIFPVDAPLATAADLQDIVDTGAISDVVVVPADRDAGTNGLYLSPPSVLDPHFGESSFSAYVRKAEEEGLRCSILPVEGLAIDVDTLEDVEKLVGDAERDNRTMRLLRMWMEQRG
jgi:2-phospho-L-lactate/phosphoenolpyruvate guanylyltransferase